jgi:hypothetical protein
MNDENRKQQGGKMPFRQRSIVRDARRTRSASVNKLYTLNNSQQDVDRRTSDRRICPPVLEHR